MPKDRVFRRLMSAKEGAAAAVGELPEVRSLDQAAGGPDMRWVEIPALLVALGLPSRGEARYPGLVADVSLYEQGLAAPGFDQRTRFAGVPVFLQEDDGDIGALAREQRRLRARCRAPAIFALDLSRKRQRRCGVPAIRGSRRRPQTAKGNKSSRGNIGEGDD
ncbi:MAG TPA: hypothetical protein VLV76_27860 [Candidatus Acidoferrum sp.]|nr:hypothetical protein [Candidatus Acidoferrum sp.]